MADSDNWDLIANVLAAEASGKPPRLFSSRRSLFGIPSALDQELAMIAEESASRAAQAASPGRPAATQQPTRVEHPIDPVFDDRSRVLVLGTMPSPKSRETGFYYNHPQNRFWKVMARLFDEPLPATNDEKRSLALRHGIALWDVLAACTIQGASDGTIAECVPNDIGWLLARVPVQAIFCTGAKAAELYARYCQPQTGMAATRLPSTSPANAAWSLDMLEDSYRQLLPYCR